MGALGDVGQFSVEFHGDGFRLGTAPRAPSLTVG